MGPQVDPVPSDETLPATADVVVIGGGIIGVSAALYMAERGLSVVLVEKGHIAGEQSSRNWGWCRQARRDPREFELIRSSLELWRGMDAHIGADTGFKTTGILYAATNEAKRAKFADWVKDAAGAGIHAEIIEGADVARLLPGDAAPPKSALYCASDGRAEPQKAAPAIALAARRAGAKIFTDCAARGIETAGGKVVSVVTERGPIKTSRVVVAGGAWTRRILADVDVLLPQLKVRSTAGRTSPVEGAPDLSCWDSGFAYRKRADGGYTIAGGAYSMVPIVPDSFRFFKPFLPAFKADFGSLALRLNGRFFTEWREAAHVPYDKPSPYEAARVLDPTPDQHFLVDALKNIQRRYPAFAGARIVQSWAGYIDAMPDAVPVISEVDTVSGLIVATGFSGHGFGIGPAAGHLVADMVTGGNLIADTHHFRISRFFDGSPIIPLTGL